MKKSFPIASFGLASLVLLCGLAAPRALGQEDQDADKEGLERRVASLETALAEEVRMHDETRARLEDTIAYLDKQAKTGQVVLNDLDLVEELGFTAGINYQSREALLATFRGFWGEQQNGLPQVATQQNEDEAKQPAR